MSMLKKDDNASGLGGDALDVIVVGKIKVYATTGIRNGGRKLNSKF
jgi:hypothetical protein